MRLVNSLNKNQETIDFFIYIVFDFIVLISKVLYDRFIQLIYFYNFRISGCNNVPFYKHPHGNF